MGVTKALVNTSQSTTTRIQLTFLLFLYIIIVIHHYEEKKRRKKAHVEIGCIILYLTVQTMIEVSTLTRGLLVNDFLLGDACAWSVRVGVLATMWALSGKGKVELDLGLHYGCCMRHV